MSTLIRLFTISFISLLLAACGGGGGVSRDDTTDPGTTPDPTYTVSVALVDASGQAATELTTDTALNVVATVRDNSNNPVADTLVTFAIAPADLAVFNNDTGTARTDSSGNATIGISVGALSGAGSISATIASGESGQTTFTSSGNGQGNVIPASLELYASSVQMASSGSDAVELTAIVKNAQSVLLEGVEVSFSAPVSAGVEIQATEPVTLANGAAKALVSTLNNAENRTITVTAQVGSVPAQTINLAIVGTEVTINGASSIILGDQVDITFRVQNSDGESIPNQTVMIGATNGSFAQSSVQTGADGQVTVAYQATTSGEDTITATALSATATFAIIVQQDEFNFTQAPADDVELNTDTTLIVTWQKDGLPYANGDITFTSSRGTVVSADALTDANGQARLVLNSDNAGIAAITATGQDDQGNQVSARSEIEFIATVPALLQVDASPDLLGPNGQTSTITAVVRDVNGNLVKGQVVSFNVSDVSTGSIAPSQATTDSNGIASTVFTSGQVTTQDSVSVTAQVVDNIAVSDSVTLTVGDRAFDVSIGTGNIIEQFDQSTYKKEFTVFVTDSVGRPVDNVALTASNTPVKVADDGVYYKGYWAWNDDDSIWVAVVTAVCNNEDTNGNGALDVGEDFNGDGYLTPGIVGTLGFVDSETETDANGQATLQLLYQKAFAPWYQSEIRVFAQSSGSEATDGMLFRYNVAGDDIDSQSESPPANPFGSSPNCADTL